MDVLLAKECGVVEVSKCALFLEGTLSRKCAEKWFGNGLVWRNYTFLQCD